MINGMILILILLISRSLMATSVGVPFMVYIYIYIYISQLIRFARASSHVSDFNSRKTAGYDSDIMRQTACLFFNLIMLESYATLLSCRAVVQASDPMTASM